MKTLFKNATAYRITDSSFISTLSNLSDFPVAECAPGQDSKTGWENPFDSEEELPYSIINGPDNEQYTILCMVTIQKVLKASAINREVNKQIKAIEQAEGRGVGRKERMNIKEEVSFHALPNALSEEIKTHAYIDHKANLLVIDQSSIGKCDKFTSALRGAIGSLSVVPLQPASMPDAVMKAWLVDNSQPQHINLHGDALFKNPIDLSQTARVKHVEIDGESVKGIINEGMMPQELSMRWNLSGVNHIDFTATDTLTIKKMVFGDDLIFNDADSEEDKEQAFNASMIINCSTITTIIMGCFVLFGGGSKD
jgi:recombination associated protein RdgC